MSDDKIEISEGTVAVLRDAEANLTINLEPQECVFTEEHKKKRGRSSNTNASITDKRSRARKEASTSAPDRTSKNTKTSRFDASKVMNVGDTVYSPDCGKLYEAKILKVTTIGSVHKYFIHYNGWARKYDTWIDEHMLALKGDDIATEQLKAFAKEHWLPTSKGGKKKGDKNGKDSDTIMIGKKKVKIIESIQDKTSESKETIDSAGAKIITPSKKRGERKRAKDASDELDAETEVSESFDDDDHLDKKMKEFDAKSYHRDLHMKFLVDDPVIPSDPADGLVIPQVIKKLLVDEWNLLTKEPRRLIRLPKEKNVTVAAVLDDFLTCKRKIFDKLEAKRDGSKNSEVGAKKKGKISSSNADGQCGDDTNDAGFLTVRLHWSIYYFIRLLYVWSSLCNK